MTRELDASTVVESVDQFLYEQQVPPEVGPLGSRPLWYVLDHPRPRRLLIIERWLKRGDLCLVTASHDSLKSTLALEMAMSIARGRLFLNRFSVHTQQPRLNVMVLQVEIDPGEYDARIRDTYHYLFEGDQRPENPYIASPGNNFKLDKYGLEDLKIEVEARAIDVVILDPLGQMWPDKARNGETFNPNLQVHVSPVLQALKAMGVTVVLVHHDPKPSKDFVGRAAGSKALENDPDVRVYLTRKRFDAPKKVRLSGNQGTREVMNWLEVSVMNRNQEPPRPFVAILGGSTGRQLIWTPHTP